MFNFIDVDLHDHVEVEPVNRDGTRFYHKVYFRQVPPVMLGTK